MEEFSVTVTRNGSVAVVGINGRVDSVTSASLDTELTRAVKENSKIVLDLQNTTYLSSAGIRAIVKASRDAKKANGEVKLAKVPSVVAEMLDLVGMTQMLVIFSSVEEATASFN
jgi:anti-sigma B factor antagonist